MPCRHPISPLNGCALFSQRCWCARCLLQHALLQFKLTSWISQTKQQQKHLEENRSNLVDSQQPCYDDLQKSSLTLHTRLTTDSSWLVFISCMSVLLSRHTIQVTFPDDAEWIREKGSFESFEAAKKLRVFV